MTKRTKARDHDPRDSDFPAYPNPHPNGVLAEWVRGRGWVVANEKPPKRTKAKPTRKQLERKVR